jgi:hypothetical protein
MALHSKDTSTTAMLLALLMISSIFTSCLNPAKEILSIVVDWKTTCRFFGQAAASSTCSPFTNFFPATTSGMSLKPPNLRHPFSASLQSL